MKKLIILFLMSFSFAQVDVTKKTNTIKEMEKILPSLTNFYFEKKYVVTNDGQVVMSTVKVLPPPTEDMYLELLRLIDELKKRIEQIEKTIK